MVAVALVIQPPISVLVTVRTYVPWVVGVNVGFAIAVELKNPFPVVGTDAHE
jgi:hypothetical protein